MAKENYSINQEQSFNDATLLEYQKEAARFILVNPTCLDWVDISFFTGAAKIILQAAKTLREKGIEVNSSSVLENLMAAKAKLPEEGRDLVFKMDEATIAPGQFDIIYYELKQAAYKRTIEELLQGMKVGSSTGGEAMRKIKDFCLDVENGFQDKRLDKYINQNIDEIQASYKVEPSGIKTNIVLSNIDGGEEHRFTLPSGAITMIGAPTGHGKSKMLQSLALDAMEELKEGEGYLYITYEENEKNVIKQLLNAYVDRNLTLQTGKHGEKHGNLESITEYLFNGETQYIRESVRQEFIDKHYKFFSSVLKSNKLRVIKPEDNCLGTLLTLLRYILKKVKIRGIFIDYIQEIYMEDNRYKSSRPDELKEIMIELDLLAQEYDIPITIAAQLNRETDSPLNMSNQNISDSGWIERKASEILLIWSNKEQCKNDEKGDKTKRVKDELPELEIGTKSKVYCLLSKSRLAISGLYTILDINGNSGRIHGNYVKSQE